jgi:hypothetical protein
MSIMKDELELGSEAFVKMESYTYNMFKVSYHQWSENCKGSEGTTIPISSFKDQIYIESS